MGSGSSKPKAQNGAVTKPVSNTGGAGKAVNKEPTHDVKSNEASQGTTPQQKQEDTPTDADASPTVSQAPVIDDEKGAVESEISYAEFPTPESLRAANERYKQKRGKKLQFSGELPPFPSYRRKIDILKAAKLDKVDQHADQSPVELLQRTLAQVVEHLIKPCKTQLERTRVCFRWLTTRNLNALPTTGAAPDSVQTDLIHIRDTKSYAKYTDLFIAMCKCTGLQVVEVRGKVRTRCELDMVSEVDNIINTWAAVAIDNEWRLVDAQFAAVKVSGGGMGDWQLVDDSSKTKAKLTDQPAEEKSVFESDEFYFLTDPEEFIYNHRPLEDAWQLLARPVTFSEFQQLAFLRTDFFEQKLVVGEYAKYQLHAFDGEQEIAFCMSPQTKYRFMYNLWRSTKGGKGREIDGYELSQFVMMHQKENRLHCKVIFPESGVYKLDIFSLQVPGESCSLVCTYIITVEAPKDNWTALPTNPRSEWGLAPEGMEMGLVPVSHSDAMLEVDNGILDVNFKCSKQPVDCLVTLRSNDSSKDKALQNCLLVRQNEDGKLIINSKLPEPGLYALDIKAKPFGSEQNTYSHVASYLVSSSSGALDKARFPTLPRQLAGQTEQNLSVKLTPKKPAESVIYNNTQEELSIEMNTPVPVAAKGTLTYHPESGGKQQDCTSYVYRQQTSDSIRFFLRFVSAGYYTFQIFAKEKGKSDSFPHVFTYVIHVTTPNAEWKPFPSAYDKWGAGCEINVTEGHIGDNVEKEFKVTVPGAEDVAVITADDKWTHLTKGSGDTFTGTVNTGPAGKMSVFAQDKGTESYSALLDFEVKSTKLLEQEAAKRREQEKAAQEAEARRLKEEEENKAKIEQELEETRKELEEATKSRDEALLKKAIAKTEKNNFTKRLEKDYTKAKNLKKSLDKMGQLRQLILSMDQKTMAIIRTYSNPPPLVHAVMRAAFLLLGNPLKETKDWKRCQALCNSIELNKRIRAFDVKQVTKDNAKKAKGILDPIRLEEMEQISEGATCFYAWTIGMSTEVLDPK